MRFLTGLTFVFVVSGCTGDLVEIGPGVRADMSGVVPDMAQGGGGEMGPNSAKFFPDIQADVDQLTCSLVGCHGGTQIPVLKPTPTAQADKDANYTNFMTDVNTTAPAQSPVLTKNLPGASHGGGAKFTGTNDPKYIRWLNWIAAGAPKQ
ncbi:MAG: hypothetical protein JWN44_185 [Myxococcales bacterium]|nr:hypothetical protein [Myxococcales bacterium]